jgi:hypothetical protein
VIVVADTTPLQYLILIQHEHILPALYGRVVVRMRNSFIGCSLGGSRNLIGSGLS